MVPYDHGAGVTPVQVFEQLSHGSLLRWSTRIGGLTADVEPALVANADRVGVVVLAVGTLPGLSLLRGVLISPIARSDGLYSSFQYLLYPPKDYPDESQMTSEHLVGTIWTTRSCHRNLFAMAKVRHSQLSISVSSTFFPLFSDTPVSTWQHTKNTPKFVITSGCAIVYSYLIA